uniref:Uncharacterized protein n=1 Tax=Rhizophora mucronata TaxID=61149 RepID=A0A2P2NSZ3_RHIMU
MSEKGSTACSQLQRVGQ